MKKTLVLSALLAVCQIILKGQTLQVWPGDANNNGLVNNVDLLQLGLGYNYFGPARDSIFTGWAPQSAQPWSQTLGNGMNAAYADADGSGLINYFHDAFPIFVHYGNTHGPLSPDNFPPGVPGVDPPLYLDESALPPVVHSGMTLSLPLVLGTAALPLEGAYGFAFSLHVDPQFVDVDDVTFNFNQNSWINPDNDRIYSPYRASSSRVDVGWVRTDHNDRDGHGAVGMVSIIIIDNVVSLEESFQLRIDSIQLIDRFGNIQAIAGDTLTITLAPDEISGNTEPRRSRFRAWPNPVHEVLHLRAPEAIRQAILFDALGREMARRTPQTPETEWPLQGLPSGIYVLEIQTDTGLFRKKIMLK